MTTRYITPEEDQLAEWNMEQLKTHDRFGNRLNKQTEVIISPLDPELQRLLDEEDAIQRRLNGEL